MKNKSALYALIFSTSILISCNSNKLNRDEYIRWVESYENGLKQTKIIDNTEFKLQYRPHTYVVLKELHIKNPTYKMLTEKEEELKNYKYFGLQIKKDTSLNKKLNNKLYEGVQLNQSAYFDLYMPGHIWLIEGKDTITCSMFHFESDGGLRPYYNFLIAFSKNTNKDTLDKVFIFDDDLIVKGVVSFTVKASDINNIPNIKL